MAAGAWGVLVVSPDPDRWLVCSWGTSCPDPTLLPRDRTPILQGGVGPFWGRWSLPGAQGAQDPGLVFSFPVAVRGKTAGYGLLGGFAAPPGDALLSAVEAAGCTIGSSFEEATAAPCFRPTDHQDFSREFDFLVRLTSRRGAAHDDNLFRWICRELPKVVPIAAVEMATVSAGLSEGVKGASPPVKCRESARRGTGTGKAAALLAAHGITAPLARYRVKETRPSGPQSFPRQPKRPAIRWSWESILRSGRETRGVLAVRLAAAPRRGSTWPLLCAVSDYLGRALQGIADHERIRALALHDCLTGLFNYRAFQELFDREFARYSRHGRNLALVLFDLDNFKSVNDTFGHRAGDEVLRKVAKTIRGNLRKTDYAFRYGGDEFVVLMAETDAGRAAVFADRVRSALAREIRGFGSFRFSLSASAGIADCTALTTCQSEELLLRADGALYQAKNEGRNRIRIASGARPSEPTLHNGAANAPAESFRPFRTVPALAVL